MLNFLLELGENYTSLDEVGPNELLVLALEHFEGVAIARRNCNNQHLLTDFADMLKNGVLPSPNVFPSSAPDESIAEIIDSLVGRDVNHGKNLFFAL